MRKTRNRRHVLSDAPENTMVAYLRVSTREQASSGAGMAAQRAVITAVESTRPWTVVDWFDDPGVSAKTLDRPGLSGALDMVRQRRAGGVVVSKLDRLSRSVLDFQALMLEADRDGWNIIALDLGVDLSTPGGRMVAGVISTIAQWEREVIVERTIEGLAAKQEAGVRLGRPRLVSDAVLRQVVGTVTRLGGYAAAARELNTKQVPTSQGGRRWYPGTVRDMCFSQDGQREQALQDQLGTV